MIGARLGAIGCALALIASACGLTSAQESATSETTVTVLVLLPRHSPSDRRDVEAIDAGIAAAVAARGGRAGSRLIRIRNGDSGDPDIGTEWFQSCPDVAARYAEDRTSVAVIGPLTNECTASVIPAFNQVEIAVVSPTANAPVFTHDVSFLLGRPGCFVTQTNRFALSGCAPSAFYPSGLRSYAHVVSTADAQGPVAAALFDELERRKIYVLVPYGDDPWVLASFSTEGERRGLEVVGIGRPDIFEASRKKLGRMATRAARSGADAIYLVAHQEADPAGRDAGVAPLLNALRTGGFRGPIVGSFAQQTGLLLEKAPAAVEGMYFTSTRLPLEALPPEAAELAHSLELDGRYALDAVYGWAAANVVLDAIAGSDGSPAGVRSALFTVARDDALGSYRIDENGDIRPIRVAVFQARKGRLVYRESMTVGSAG